MKKISFIFACIFVFSCNCKKPITNSNNVADEIVSKITSICPEDGKCTAVIFKRKKIELIRDQFGKLYYQMRDSETTYVVKYDYIRNPLPDTQDSGYREEIVFELNNIEQELNYTDFELSNQKFLFGRFCFCRGQTGYYPIFKGNINLKNSKLNIDFSTTEVPQVIKSFEIDLK
jgi:hypothetical protein